MPKGSAAATSIRSIPELGRRGIIRLAVRRRPPAAAAVEEANRSGDMNDDEGFCANDMIFDEGEVYQRYDAVFNSAGTQEMADNNDGGGKNGNDEEELLLVGFFPKPGHFNGECFADAGAAAAAVSTKSPSNSGNGLHGATKTGAKKRLAALRKSLKADEKRQKQAANDDQGKATTKGAAATKKRRRKEAPVKEVDDGIGESLEVDEGKNVPAEPVTESQSASVGETDAPADTHSESVEPDVAADINDSVVIKQNNDSAEAREALECYRKLMGVKPTAKESSSPTFKTNTSPNEDDTAEPEPLMLPGQTAFAGCKPAREI